MALTLARGTYVEPRKKARERLNLNRKTETTAVSSIATEVEYTCNNVQQLCKTTGTFFEVH